MASDVAATALVVDDEPVVRRVLARALRRAWPGVAVEEARGVAEARAKLADLRPQLVVADLGLGDGSGLELCRYIQGHPWCHRTHVLVVTGHASSELRERAFSAGASEFLPKPFALGELEESARRLLA